MLKILNTGNFCKGDTQNHVRMEREGEGSERKKEQKWGRRSGREEKKMTLRNQLMIFYHFLPARSTFILRAAYATYFVQRRVTTTAHV